MHLRQPTLVCITSSLLKLYTAVVAAALGCTLLLLKLLLLHGLLQKPVPVSSCRLLAVHSAAPLNAASQLWPLQ